ncbi:FMN-binding glutamate synthase family protein [Gramella jeungdoensis]|uniref:FMN-binding glutamate synthase family protein n=1 Tax=Gramella jeungdoensis TaxID=708091 RepID=A0ABT0Z014_9FLAO|nr:FMN-binding glutamate synthase family protein [Gramella jeungdoensis]MCM8568124.1 FMN-binding glutamate synthase family protein [Gramella jeungdoensis]
MQEAFDIIKDIPWWGWILIFLAIVAIADIFFNKKHTIKHNFPVVGHLRYWLESIGPELRQYIVANNREELPFNRRERGWIYASAKNMDNYEGFGTDQDIFSTNYIFINNALLPYKLPEGHPNLKNSGFVPSAKLMGEYNKRRRPYRPASVINVSAMSFGSLSAKAIESLNKGCKLSGAYHNTGEGGFSPYHQKGADVVFQIGTGYFGVRDENGNFSMDKLVEMVDSNPQIRAIELKLSQGAKPGKGGVLPAAKISKEISKIRGVPMGKDVISPPYHSAFSDMDDMVDFIEKIADATGLPTGIKSAVGQLNDWENLARIMEKKDCGPDFITIDGGEGGTGAAPPSFADHVSLPWIYGFTDVYKVFQKHKLTHRLVFIASGKLGFPAKATMAFALGADLINVAREAMMSVGCIQAQSCHTNTCPSGVATQNKWLQAGINVKDKAIRTNFYFTKFRKELLQICHASGHEHPCQFNTDDVDINLSDKNLAKTLATAFSYHKDKVNFASVQELLDCPHLGGNLNLKKMRKTEDAID